MYIGTSGSENHWALAIIPQRRQAFFQQFELRRGLKNL